MVNNLWDDDVERLLARAESRISRTLRSVLRFCRDATQQDTPEPEAEIVGCCRYLAMLQLGRTRFAKDIGIEAL